MLKIGMICILREKIVQDWKANTQSFILNAETLDVKLLERLKDKY
jgi:hypothetical protein